MKPITRKEKILDAILSGNTDNIPTPITREETYLKAIAENGGGGGGAESTIAWKPTVDANGNISWTRTSSTTVPATQNIKGNKGNTGETGPAGPGLASGGVAGSLLFKSSNDDYATEWVDSGIATVEGNPVTAETDSAGIGVKTVVDIEPQQDLHGYDAPWVGGAGKNKLKDDLYYDQTLNGITFARQADGGIKITGTATKNFRFNYGNAVELKTGQYILSGGATKIEIALQSFGYVTTTTKSITVESDSTYEAWLYLYDDTAYNTIIYPMLRPSNTDATFAPYSNICPISGFTEANITVADDVDNPTVSNTYTIDLDGTRYGGKLDVTNGVLTVDKGYIASYNGETLPSTWISDRDVYVEGTSPTTGAQVVYELATPYTISLPPHQIKLLQGVNNLSTNAHSVSLTYRKGKVAMNSDLEGLADSVNVLVDEVAMNSDLEGLADSVNVLADEVDSFGIKPLTATALSDAVIISTFSAMKINKNVIFSCRVEITPTEEGSMPLFAINGVECPFEHTANGTNSSRGIEGRWAIAQDTNILTWTVVSTELDESNDILIQGVLAVK